MPKPHELSQRLAAALGFPPTGSQERLFTHLSAFLLDQSGDRPVFLMQGFAGTGKTTVMAAVSKVLPVIGMKSLMMAPTGRAAKVMSGYSHQKAFTIHRMIYQWDGEQDGFEHRLQKNNRQKMLYIVDEASMIGEQAYTGRGLLRELIEYIFQDPESGNKLLLVGDPAQLPPVGESQSPALRISHLKQMNLQASGFQLRDVVRQQAQSGILENATRIREQIRQDAFLIKLSSQAEDVHLITGMDLEDQIRRCYDQYGTEGTVIICRSNKQAVQYNQYIKRQLFFSEDELDAGDQVMIVKNNYHWLPEGSAAGFIANGDFGEIQRINRLEEAHGYRFANVTIRLTDQEHAEAFEAMVHLQPLHDPTPNLPIKEQKAIRELVEADWAGADTDTASERREGIANDPYLNALQIKFAYALTCHKSQGGQWPAVFIDLGFLKEEMMNTDLMRWLYTAITRATHELFLVNFPPDFLDPDAS